MQLHAHINILKIYCYQSLFLRKEKLGTQNAMTLDLKHIFIETKFLRKQLLLTKTLRF